MVGTTVVKMPAGTYAPPTAGKATDKVLSVDEVLDGAARAGLKTCVVLGFDEHGIFHCPSSTGEAGTLILLAQRLISIAIQASEVTELEIVQEAHGDE